MACSFDELPLKYGEESRQWNNLMARYGHTGCPGLQFEDVCAEPWECAVRGCCRISYERARTLNKEEK